MGPGFLEPRGRCSMFHALSRNDLHAALDTLGTISESASGDGHFARHGVSALGRLVASDLTTLSVCNLETGHRTVVSDVAGAAWGVPPAAGTAAQASLTVRERDVLGWVCAGKTDRDIADILAISPRTVHKHLQRIYEKLGVETRTAAAARWWTEVN